MYMLCSVERLHAIRYPSVSMVNWTTGAGTSRVRVLELLIQQLPVGVHLMETAESGDVADVFGQAYVSSNGTEQKVLVINKRSTQQAVTVVGATGGLMYSIDEQSGEQPPRQDKLTSDSITMAPFAVSLIQLPAIATSSTNSRTHDSARTAAE